MKELKNREALIEQVSEMLIQFDIDRNQYQTDVYAYYNEETEEATLNTFTNVGGNSWLNDDHITIYSDKEHYETEYDYYQTIEDLASVLGFSKDELIEKTVEYLEKEKGLDDVNRDDIDYYEVRDYIDDTDEVKDMLLECYNDAVRCNDYDFDYIGKAIEIIEQLEEMLNRPTYE